jgi:hypothetical protein
MQDDEAGVTTKDLLGGRQASEVPVGSNGWKYRLEAYCFRHTLLISHGNDHRTGGFASLFPSTRLVPLCKHKVSSH